MFDYLVTGSKGYIGSRLADILLEKQKKIKLIDNNYFDDCNLDFDIISDNLSSARKDIRNISEKDFEGVRNVMHLAALSNDPIGNLNSSVSSMQYQYTRVWTAFFFLIRFYYR